jgi:ABC-2 type transport system permease protein
MNFQQGTLPWFLQHELRLWWRNFSGKWIVIGTMALFGIFMAVMLTLWLSFAAISDRIRQLMFFESIPDGLLWAAGGVCLLLFTFSLLSATHQTLSMMFERSDLDLLISSPISTKTVLTSRLLGLAIENFLGICLFFVPLTIVIVPLGFIRLLGIYPALFAICIITSSLAILINLALVKLLGARNARIVSQFMGYILSIVFFLLSQSATLFEKQLQAALVWWNQATLPNGFFHSQGWIWLPAKAIFSDFPSLTLLLISSAAILWLTVQVSHLAFVKGTQQSLTTKKNHPQSNQKIRFKTNSNWIFLLKEWRSIIRNPYILSRLLYTIIAYIPLLILVFQRSNAQSADRILATLSTGIPLFGATFSSTLGAICFSAEEAPDLLKSSPVPSNHLRWLKLLAVLIPGWLIASPLFIILVFRGGAWFSSGVVFLLATICHAILSLWSSRPIPLSSLFSGKKGMIEDYGLLILQLLSLMVFFVLALVVSQGNLLLTLIFLIIELFIMLGAYARSRSIGTSLGF